MSFNFPNILTLIRVSLIPVLVLFYYLPLEYANQIVAIIFVIASFTDWLDGYIARKYNQETKFGAFCDPVADKLIVVIALLLLLESFCSFYITLPAIIIIGRELVISGLREWMAHQGEANIVSVVYMGKVKTFCQMVAIAILLFNKPDLANVYVQIGVMMLIVAALLTLLTMIQYIYKAWPKLLDHKS